MPFDPMIVAPANKRRRTHLTDQSRRNQPQSCFAEIVNHQPQAIATVGLRQ
jgi:hypothetical protein